MRYFCVMTGLRGCYMPDSSYPVAVKTRRDLKDILTDAAEFATDHNETRQAARKRGERYNVPAREVASVAAALWRRSWQDRDSHLSTVIPYGPGDSHGIQVNPISRAEYLAMESEDE